MVEQKRNRQGRVFDYGLFALPLEGKLDAIIWTELRSRLDLLPALVLSSLIELAQIRKLV
jgi:hypothetical protein